MAFGYDSTTGWLPATYDALLEDLKNKYQAETTDNTDVENGAAADLLRTLASMFKDAWDDQAFAYNAGFITAAPGTNGVAEGSSLELLLTPKIGPKLAAVASTVVLPLFADPGPNVNVPAGQTVVLDGETTPWTLTAPAVIPGGGSIDGTFEYSETGPKTVVAASTWSILTPVSGWASVGPNAADAIPGRNAETDAEYRQRYRESLLNNIIAKVRQVDGVTSAAIIEWPFGYPDSFWGVSHWFEVLVVGGADADVAAAIQATRAKGTSTQGNTSVSITDSDYVSGSVTIKFSRPVLVPLYVDVTITKGEGYPADNSAEAVAARVSAIKAAVQTYIQSLGPGQDTSTFLIASYINANAGIAGIADITVLADVIDPPTVSGVIEVELRDQLTVDLADIDVTGA